MGGRNGQPRGVQFARLFELGSAATSKQNKGAIRLHIVNAKKNKRRLFLSC